MHNFVSASSGGAVFMDRSVVNQAGVFVDRKVLLSPPPTCHTGSLSTSLRKDSDSTNLTGQHQKKENK